MSRTTTDHDLEPVFPQHPIDRARELRAIQGATLATTMVVVALTALLIGTQPMLLLGILAAISFDLLQVGFFSLLGAGPLPEGGPAFDALTVSAGISFVAFVVVGILTRL